ncbi:MAG: hypothetical protein ACUZ8H_00795 [Candidatus Anammoxibacter sp.]
MKYYITNADGNIIPAESGGFLNITETLTADRTLAIRDSGKIFHLDAIGEDIVLPPVKAGLNYHFICQVTTVTSNWTVTSATEVIQGQVTVAGALIAAANESLITLVIAKFLPGDWFTLSSDGINWYVAGQVVTALGITFTAP